MGVASGVGTREVTDVGQCPLNAHHGDNLTLGINNVGGEKPCMDGRPTKAEAQVMVVSCYGEGGEVG